ncbi:hypothetical protein TUBRATIS_14800 [Tubulinosema ratisbonensis]|uniref:Uncharacterized protein n=1 Tax=Tubulinosema ratisbonensis TaxID=291195 RepID=A0A437AM35_9MICR|nr:hypothetical protein TUBRATIS_14800 [Tubulinosema ratisbonensis]
MRNTLIVFVFKSITCSLSSEEGLISFGTNSHECLSKDVIMEHGFIIHEAIDIPFEQISEFFEISQQNTTTEEGYSKTSIIKNQSLTSLDHAGSSSQMHKQTGFVITSDLTEDICQDVSNSRGDREMKYTSFIKMHIDVSKQHKLPFIIYLNKITLSNYEIDMGFSECETDSEFKSCCINIYDLLTNFFSCEKDWNLKSVKNDYILLCFETSKLKKLCTKYKVFTKNIETLFEVILEVGDLNQVLESYSLSNRSSCSYLSFDMELIIQATNKYEFIKTICSEIEIFSLIDYTKISQRCKEKVYVYFQTIIYIYELNKDIFFKNKTPEIASIYYNNKNLLKFVFFVRFLILKLFIDLKIEYKFIRRHKAITFLSFLRYKHPNFALKFNYLDVYYSELLNTSKPELIYKRKKHIGVVYSNEKFYNEPFTEKYRYLTNILSRVLSGRFGHLTDEILHYERYEFKNLEDISFLTENNAMNEYINSFHQNLVDIYNKTKSIENLVVNNRQETLSK